MRTLIFILFSVQLFGQFGYVAIPSPDTVGAGYYSDISGIPAGGGAEWYNYNSLPAADDTIYNLTDLKTVPIANGTYFVKGRINMDSEFGFHLPSGVTLTGTHRKQGGYESEFYWTADHADTLTGGTDLNSMFHLNKNNISFIGINFVGKDTIISQVDQDRRAISADSFYAKFVNCEFGYFERNGIDMQSPDAGSRVDVEYCYFHDCHFYCIIMIRNNTILDVKYSYFEAPWHSIATNSDIYGFRYSLDGCVFVKKTRPHEDIWDVFQWGGRMLTDVHAPGAGASGEIDIFITYCTFFREPVNRVYDPWQDGDIEVYDLYIRDDALSDTMDTLVFQYNIMNRPSNATHGASYRIDLTTNASLISNNIVNPHPIK